MTWQQYQTAVFEYYRERGNSVTIEHDVYLRDIFTGSLRQIDTLVRVNGADHQILIIVDAKHYNRAIDVNHVDSVDALTKAVGGNKAVIVASNGWSSPAARKAHYLNLELLSLTESEAYEYLGEAILEDCPFCRKPVLEKDWQDYWLDADNFVTLTEFQCSNTGCSYRGHRCEDCSDDLSFSDDVSKLFCSCGHLWVFSNGRIQLHKGAN